MNAVYSEIAYRGIYVRSDNPQLCFSQEYHALYHLLQRNTFCVHLTFVWIRFTARFIGLLLCFEITLLLCKLITFAAVVNN